MKYLLGNVKIMCEIGMGAGFSMLNFLVATTDTSRRGDSSSPWLQGAKLYLFDLPSRDSCYYPRKEVAYEYANKHFNGVKTQSKKHQNVRLSEIDMSSGMGLVDFGGRVRWYFGDSRRTVQKASKTMAKHSEKCDFMHIDGSHTEKDLLQDIVAMRAIASNNTLLFIDDVQFPDVRYALAHAVKDGFLEIVSRYSEYGQMDPAFVSGHANSPQGAVKEWVSARFRFRQ